MMTNEEKKSYLSILYNLRAGLSVISDEKDKYESLKNSLEQEKVEYISAMDSAKKSLEKLHNEYKQLEVFLEKPMKEYSSKAFKSLFGGILCILLGIACAVLLIMSLVQDRHPIAILFCIADPEWGKNIWLIFLVPALLILSIFLFSKSKKLLEDVPSRFKEYSYRKKAPKQIITVGELGAKQVQQVRERERTFTQSQREKKSQMIKIKKSCESMFKILIQTYEQELDSRDWKYVDLMIFYFESRRADSLKEALQLVDEQVQTNSIMDAIGTATQDLKNIILYSATKTAQIMSSGFSLLSNRMQIMQVQADIKNEQLQELASAQRMSNALKQKANTSSLQLMEDVAYIRSVVEKSA